MRLYGTTTSPFVRRVRVVSEELGLSYTLVDTSTPDGQAALRERTPIWKVPVAELEGRTVLDSRAIIEELLLRHGPGPFAAPVDRVRASNVANVIDGALESAIRRFYLARDGVRVDEVAYLVKERDRVRASLAWLERELGPDEPFGLLTVALVSTLDWMAFRRAHPVEEHPALLALAARFAARPSIARTVPVVS